MGIFDQIKNAFAKTEAAPVNQPAPAEPAKAEPAEPEARTSEPVQAQTRTYTVLSGDTLWKIAEEQYGDGKQYQKIFEANRDHLESPDQILPGQELVIP